jgi:hypothetical protein
VSARGESPSKNLVNAQFVSQLCLGLLSYGVQMVQADNTNQPGKTQVPGQLLGYALQYTRMLSLLLETDEHAVVSLEVFEDVGVQGSGETIASQTKSSTTKNPVSNRAEPLWKTFHNWLDAIPKQLSLEQTVFELYVFGDFQGEICSLFSDAKSEADARVALSKAKKLLSTGSEPLSHRISEVLNADEKKLLTLITKFRYRHGSGESVEDLKNLLGKTLIPPEFIDSVLTHAVGWVKQEADKLLEKGQLAAIAVEQFRSEVAAYARALAFSACLADMAGPALPEEIEKSRSSRYVRQLDLIAIADERKLRAISAYLRSSVNRQEWGRLGIVHAHSLDDFENRLSGYWLNSRTQCEISLSTRTVIERGQYVLAECMKFSSPLQGQAVPHDFLEGCFHTLADDLLVGWHPNFEELTADWK